MADMYSLLFNVLTSLDKTTLTAPTVGSNRVQKLNKQKTEICALCEAVMLMLENILKENSTQVNFIYFLPLIFSADSNTACGDQCENT